MAFTCAILALLFLDESYPPIVLVSKARELRRKTKNWGIHSRQEEVEVDLKELVTKNVSRPLRILFQEPIVLLVSIYVSHSNLIRPSLQIQLTSTLLRCPSSTVCCICLLQRTASFLDKSTA